jgi:hypothetical protein
LDPVGSNIQYNIACTESILNLTDESINSLKKAISVDPYLKKTAKQDKDFKNIK